MQKGFKTALHSVHTTGAYGSTGISGIGFGVHRPEGQHHARRSIRDSYIFRTGARPRASRAPPHPSPPPRARGEPRGQGPARPARGERARGDDAKRVQDDAQQGAEDAREMRRAPRRAPKFPKTRRRAASQTFAAGARCSSPARTNEYSYCQRRRRLRLRLPRLPPPRAFSVYTAIGRGRSSCTCAPTRGFARAPPRDGDPPRRPRPPFPRVPDPPRSSPPRLEPPRPLPPRRTARRAPPPPPPPRPRAPRRRACVRSVLHEEGLVPRHRLAHARRRASSVGIANARNGSVHSRDHAGGET